MGIFLTIVRAGSVLNNYLTPALAKKDLGYAILGGFLIYIMSFISGITFVIFEKRAIRKDDQRSSACLRQTYRIALITKFGIQFWLITLNIMFAYIGFESFYNISKKYLESKFDHKLKEMDTIASLNYLVPILFSPLFGYLTDRFGRKVTIMAIATFILSISHLIFLIVKVPNNSDKAYVVILPLCMIGFAYGAYFVSVWSSIPIVVRPNCFGTAFGITFAIQNIGLAVSPLIASALINNRSEENEIIAQDDNRNDPYKNVMIYFMVCSIIAFILSLVLYAVDKINLIIVTARIRQRMENHLLYSTNE